MKISEIEKILTTAKNEHGDIHVRVWWFDVEDETTMMIKDCFKSEFTVRHLYFNKKEEYKETPCVILQLDNRDDKEKTVFHH